MSTLAWLALVGLSRSRFSPSPSLRVLGGWAGLAYALLVAATIMALGWRRLWWTRRNTLRALTAATVLGGGAVAVELCARWLSPPSPFHDWLPGIPGQRLEFPGLKLRGVTPGCHTTNEWGLRGDPPPPPARWGETFTILAVGGSTTHCAYLDDARTWPRLLQDRLADRLARPVWVGNAGFDGHSTRGHLVVMEHMARLIRPDLVVLMVGINDLALSVDRGALIGGNGFDEFRFQLTRPRSLLDQLRTIQLFRLWKAARFEGAVPQPEVGHSDASPPEREEFPPLPADLRQLLPSLPQFRANVVQLVQLARRDGIQVLFLTQPLLWRDTPEWGRRVGRVGFLRGQELQLSAAALWRMLELFNRELQEVCRELGVACHDLAAEVPPSQEIFYDFCHFTDAGAALVSERVSQAVLERVAPGR